MNSLLDALTALKHDYPTNCWCGVAIGNPNYRDHSPQCKQAQAAYAAATERVEQDGGTTFWLDANNGTVTICLNGDDLTISCEGKDLVKVNNIGEFRWKRPAAR